MRRSELLAQEFGATLHFITFGQKGSLLLAPVRYLVQGWRTWRVLRRERPEIIFVQNPPIFGVLAVFIFSRWIGAQYVIDSHSGAFLSAAWRWSVGLHRWLSRRALLTIVHNVDQGQIVEDWGCRYCVMSFTPGDYPVGEPFPLHGQFNVAVINTNAEDEPLADVFEAAARLPQVQFYVTGGGGRMASWLLQRKPDNVEVTGYLPYGRYTALLRHADVILDLTTRDHTLLMGGFEAIALGTPLIVSDWPVLQDYFRLGAVHVPNTVEGICRGVQTAESDHARLKAEMLLLRERLTAEWKKQAAAMRELLERPPADSRASGAVGRLRFGETLQETSRTKPGGPHG